MLLELKEVNIGYQNVLVHGINAQLDYGKMVLLVGDNGVGKSSLFKSILGLLPLHLGEIYLKGRNLNRFDNQEIAKYISMVFSNNALVNQYSVFDLVALGKYIHYPYYISLSEKDKEEIKKCIISLGLEAYEDKKVNELSDGNLKKAFIGRALVQNSELMILDEPTTHLDETNKFAILESLRNIAKTQNKCILFSSHDWRIAHEFADEIWFIENQSMKTGLTEDILLKNDYFKQKTIKSNGKIATPEIFAPEILKNLLTSLLLKNTTLNFIPYTFKYENKLWEIYFEQKLVKTCANFTEIKVFLEHI